MIFYYAIYILILIIALIKNTKAYWLIFFIILSLAFFRPDNVGSDYISYCFLIQTDDYNITWSDVVQWYTHEDYSDNTIGVSRLREFGFSFLVLFLNSLFNSPKLTIFAIILITYSLYLYNFKKLCRQGINIAVFIGFAIFIFYSSFNTLRQGLSISIIFTAATLLYNHKYIQALILGLIAVSIHFSALFILPIIVLALYVSIPKKVAITVLAILIVLSLIKVNINPFFVIPNDIAGRDLDSGWSEGFAVYNIYIHYLSFFFNCILSYVFIWFYSRSDLKDRYFFILWFIGLALYIPLMFSPNIGRISEFLYVFQIIAITRTILYLYTVDRKNYKNALFLMLFYCSIWHGFYVLRNWYGLQPYFSI